MSWLLGRVDPGHLLSGGEGIEPGLFDATEALYHSHTPWGRLDDTGKPVVQKSKGLTSFSVITGVALCPLPSSVNLATAVVAASSEFGRDAALSLRR